MFPLIIKKVVKLLVLSLITGSLIFYSKISFCQTKKYFNDSLLLKKEIDSVLAKHGLKSRGFTINVISLNQKGGQTAYSITNNYYGTVNINKEKELTEQDETSILRKIDSVKNIVHITSNDIMFFKSQYCNVPKFAAQLKTFLINKGYDLNKYLGVSLPQDVIGLDIGYIDVPGNDKEYIVTIA